MTLINNMLKRYEINSQNDLINALKEIFQEITLLGLYRGGFFQEAVFYGGTALRIIYGLDRFCEDLDFSLLKKDDTFDIEKYFGFIRDEFEALGVNVSIKKKNKTKKTNIESAFLKNDTDIYDLKIEVNDSIIDMPYSKSLKIKIEVDINPPLDFDTEVHTLLYPVSFNIVAMSLDALYAGKVHALLFRKWKNRVKGRDWYDFEWYVKRKAKINLTHLKSRMIESGDFDKNDILTKEKLKDLLIKKIDEVDFEKAKEEVKLFLKNTASLEIWSKDYFKFLVDKLEIKE